MYERCCEWAKNNPEKLRGKSRRRRAKSKMVEEVYSVDDEQITRQIFNNRCANCEAQDNLHIDHHMPLSKGYALSIYNTVLLCYKCNISKGSKMPCKFYDPDKLA